VSQNPLRAECVLSMASAKVVPSRPAGRFKSSLAGTARHWAQGFGQRADLSLGERFRDPALVRDRRRE
jgi:hypothetical protein